VLQGSSSNLASSTELTSLIDNAKKLSEIVSRVSSSSLNPQADEQASPNTKKKKQQQQMALERPDSTNDGFVDARVVNTPGGLGLTPSPNKKSSSVQASSQPVTPAQTPSTVRGARSKYGMIVPVPPGSPSPSAKTAAADAVGASRHENMLTPGASIIPNGKSSKTGGKSKKKRSKSSEREVNGSGQESAAEFSDFAREEAKDVEAAIINRPKKEATNEPGPSISQKLMLRSSADNTDTGNSGDRSSTVEETDPQPQPRALAKKSSKQLRAQPQAQPPVQPQAQSQPSVQTLDVRERENQAEIIRKKPRSPQKIYATQVQSDPDDDDGTDIDLDGFDTGGSFRKAKALHSAYAITSNDSSKNSRPYVRSSKATNSVKASTASKSSRKEEPSRRSSAGNVLALFSSKGSGKTLMDMIKGTGATMFDSDDEEADGENLQKGSALDHEDEDIDLDEDVVDSGGQFAVSNVHHAAYATPRVGSVKDSEKDRPIAGVSKPKPAPSSFYGVAKVLNGRNVVSKATILSELGLEVNGNASDAESVQSQGNTARSNGSQDGATAPVIQSVAGVPTKGGNTSNRNSEGFSRPKNYAGKDNGSYRYQRALTDDSEGEEENNGNDEDAEDEG
jgi:hypothetical protein